MKIVISSKIPEPLGPEIVERKGRGHPDTLTDHLADVLSNKFCQYTLERFGEVLHHNFDKVGLLGGKSVVAFGRGELIEPIRVLLNGRAADAFHHQPIPLRDLLVKWTEAFLQQELPLLNPSKDLVFHYNVSNSNTAGYPTDDFRPESTAPARQRLNLLSSDTAALCASFPPTPLEVAVYSAEKLLTDNNFRTARPWLGSDIKVLGVRFGEEVEITACIPQIARYVGSSDEYLNNLSIIREILECHFAEHLLGMRVSITLNSKDDAPGNSFYLTAIGSCIESGDEGMVGRGNRPNGLISVCRPFSGEAACGKNPMFFPGKVYNAVAIAAAQRLYEISGVASHVWLVAQEGRTLADPWWAMVIFEGAPLNQAAVERILADQLGRISEHSDALIEGRIELC
jgi:S-adenosylmethionine synthetase